MQMNQFICCLYQNLTDFIWSFVYYQISIDLSKFIPDMDQAWEKKKKSAKSTLSRAQNVFSKHKPLIWAKQK